MRTGVYFERVVEHFGNHEEPIDGHTYREVRYPVKLAGCAEPDTVFWVLENILEWLRWHRTHPITYLPVDVQAIDPIMHCVPFRAEWMDLVRDLGQAGWNRMDRVRQDMLAHLPPGVDAGHRYLFADDLPELEAAHAEGLALAPRPPARNWRVVLSDVPPPLLFGPFREGGVRVDRPEAVQACCRLLLEQQAVSLRVRTWLYRHGGVRAVRDRMCLHSFRVPPFDEAYYDGDLLGALHHAAQAVRDGDEPVKVGTRALHALADDFVTVRRALFALPDAPNLLLGRERAVREFTDVVHDLLAGLHGVEWGSRLEELLDARFTRVTARPPGHQREEAFYLLNPTPPETLLQRGLSRWTDAPLFVGRAAPPAALLDEALLPRIRETAPVFPEYSPARWERALRAVTWAENGQAAFVPVAGGGVALDARHVPAERAWVQPWPCLDDARIDDAELAWAEAPDAPLYARNVAALVPHPEAKPFPI